MRTLPSCVCRALAVVAAVTLLLAADGIAAILALSSRYAGSYVVEGTTSAQSLQIELEKQHGRRFRVSVFAMNQPEYMGHGHLTADNASVKIATHATGRRHLVLTATVLDGGATLDGTFIAKRPAHASTTGTFTVTR